MTMIIMLVCAVPLFILGLFIRKGRGLMLLAGYNTMSKEARDKIDKTRLSKIAGNLILRIALSFALMGVAMHFDLTWIFFILMAFFIIDLAVTIIRLNLGSTKNLVIASVIIGIIALTFAGVGVMIYNGERETVVNVLANKIEIKGMYGLDIDFSDVAGISLIEKSMSEIGTGRKTNGYDGFGQTLKGNFNSGELGKILLFVKSDQIPTIWIELEGKEDIYISFNNSEKTRELYNKLSESVR